MEKEYPYTTEYAKSNRSSCKSCKDTIAKDSLRMAIMVQSRHFDGKVPTWFHFNCFFKKSKVRTIEDIKNIDLLRWDDQEKIKSQINVTEIDEVGFEFSVEYAKSNRSKCVKCEIKIEKEEIRISQKENENSKSKRSTKQWCHVDCFVDLKKEIVKSAPKFDIEKVAGFPSLNDVDQKELVSKFKKWKSKKKPQSSGDDAPESKIRKVDNGIDSELKEQNKMLWAMRDKLNREVSKNAIAPLLNYNNQYIPKGEANLLNSLADCMVFGCLSPCPECGGVLGYSSNRYKCRSMINEWSKCLFETRDVIRLPFKIPQDYLDVDVLKNYSYQKRPRLLAVEVAETKIIEPLKGYFITVDRVKFENDSTILSIDKRIKSLGGELLKTVTPKTLVLISTIKENAKSFVSKAKSYSIDVVRPDFLDNLENENVLDAVKNYSIVDWGRSNEQLIKMSSVSERDIDHQKEDIVVFTVKGGAAVDPDSNLEDKAHLYQDKGTKDPLNAILGLADVARGSNSFYKLQLLESDKKSKWWVFRAWGRIGTTIGGNKVESFYDLHEAIHNFEAIYLEKTGNQWKDRKGFQKYPNKFAPIDVDYGQSSLNKLSVQESDSRLQPSLQELIRFIFDMESMKLAMSEFQIDLNRMPLGKLSQNQINISYQILIELQDMLANPDPSKNKLMELSNRFYTMMPHNFGMRTPPIINSLVMVKEKCEMIESLMEMEVAFKLMTTEGGKNSVDTQYEKLNSRIVPLDKSSEEYMRVATYLKNTHGSTHNNFKIQIQDVFDVSREGEDDRFNSFKNLSNRMMLWHGSRRMNWAGILSQGLKIAPKEAPMSGYMFGKGIYFADMVSKSANYCHTSQEFPECLLLLCEVALGTISERHHADEKIKLKKGEHSCKGVGMTIPNPSKNIVDKDGVIYPLGKPIKQNINSSLLYNEYIVYDIGQVRQRYVVKVRFDFKK